MQVILAQSAAVFKALKHGWFIVSMGRDAIFMEHFGGKCKGTIYVTCEGHVGYCPF